MATTIIGNPNQLRGDDRAVHDWYRFVQSFPPHLVRTYLHRLGIGPEHLVLDPFCGSGTTLVECKKNGIASVGIDSHPMAYFASSVKVDWTTNGETVLDYIRTVEQSYEKSSSVPGVSSLPLFESDWPNSLSGQVGDEVSKLLIKNSISPEPARKALLLLEKIDEHGNEALRRYGRLALADALVNGVSNLKFGPEVGVGKVREDAPVLSAWVQRMRRMAYDIQSLSCRSLVHSHIFRSDARHVGEILEPNSINAVITSPPYPNEKDYTRTTRLESVLLGLINNRQELRQVKQDLLRSNTRGVYKADDDDQAVVGFPRVVDIADSIERRRVELGKTSGFERLYPRVTLLYFGGMLKHLASLTSVLRPGAKLAYVVGDQASFLRVMIPTGQILADIAESLGYRVTSIDLFRTRFSTATGDNLREEVVLMEWSGDRSKGSVNGQPE